MKKWSKFSIITYSSIALLNIVYFASTLPIIIKTNNSVNQKILSNEIVKNNFASNGKWANRFFLNHEDFEDYDTINSNAFDGIGINLEYIELPSSITIYSAYNFSNVINWTNVNEIRVYETNTKNVFIKNNILFVNYDNKIYASSIANRINPSNEILFFPCYKSSNPDYSTLNYEYYIAHNFYSIDNATTLKILKKLIFTNLLILMLLTLIMLLNH